MKKLKCPICGSERTFLDIIPQGYQYLCTQCGLCALRQFTPQEAAEAWNELVSKFPPVMRVQKGDKIIYFNNLYHRQGGVVMGVDFTTMRILLEDGSTPPDMVVKWPWELEQK